MAKYLKKNPRLAVKFFDGDTKEQLFEINDRNWMNVGELFADHYVTELVKQTGKKILPQNVVVIVSGEYDLN